MFVIIRLLDEVMILPVTVIGLLCTSEKLAYVLNCLVFLSVSRLDIKQYANSIKNLIVITGTFFFFHL